MDDVFEERGLCAWRWIARYHDYATTTISTETQKSVRYEMPMGGRAREWIEAALQGNGDEGLKHRCMVHISEAEERQKQWYQEMI